MYSKRIFESKTFWVNIVSVVAIVTQCILGKEIIPPEAQMAILSLVNLILRLYTRKEIVW